MRFKIVTGIDGETEEVSGRLIYINPYGYFFVDHRLAWKAGCRGGNRLCYVITEPITGLRVSLGFTVKEAVGNTKSRIGHIGKQALLKAINNSVEKRGVINDL